MDEPPPQGELTFIDNTVDPTTGMIQLRATFPNRQQRIVAGTICECDADVVGVDQRRRRAVAGGANRAERPIHLRASNPIRPIRPSRSDRLTIGVTYQGVTVIEKWIAGGRNRRDRWPVAARAGRDGERQCRRSHRLLHEFTGKSKTTAMSVPELFIRRPVMTTLVMSGILLVGLIGFRQLPVSDLPSVDYPTINVSASLPGASPETMASAVATPLEKQFSTIAGVDSMSSVSAQGVSQITIQFSLDRNIDAAAQDVQGGHCAARRNNCRRTCRRRRPTGKSIRRTAPILYLAMSSPTLPLSTVDNYAENLLAQEISMVNGVAQVSVFGSQQYAVRIQVDPNKLAAYGLGIDQVEQAVEAGNVDQPLGILYGKHQAFTVQANGQLEDAAAFRPMIVAYRNGNPVRLEQLGNVLDSVQNDKMAAWYNTHGSSAAPSCWPSSASRARTRSQVVDNIKKLLPQFREADSGGGEAGHSLRPFAVHPQVGVGRGTHALPGRLPGGHGDFHFPAEPVGDAHSQPGAADVHHRHLRRDGAARLQPRQSFAHGADAVRRVRGGRRDRDARKHRAPHGKRRAADGGGAERLARKSASPSFP